MLPYGEHMCIVSGGDGRYLVKCFHCGHEFCEHTENWKLEALIHVRDSEEKLLEIYPRMMHGDPAWEESASTSAPAAPPSSRSRPAPATRRSTTSARPGGLLPGLAR